MAQFTLLLGLCFVLELWRAEVPGDATVLKRFFRDNFVTFRRGSRRIAIFGIGEFFYVCLPICNFSIFGMVT